MQFHIFINISKEKMILKIKIVAANEIGQFSFWVVDI